MFALAASLAVLTIGVLSGAALTFFQDTIYAAARREIIKRPEIHHFAGAEVIDQARIAEVADQSNTALRLLHTHALGVGLLILAATLILANIPIAPGMRTALSAVISLGALYPLGWLVLAWFIPFLGVDALRGSIDMLFFLPFGGAMVLGFVFSLAICLVATIRRFIDGEGAQP